MDVIDLMACHTWEKMPGMAQWSRRERDSRNGTSATSKTVRIGLNQATRTVERERRNQEIFEMARNGRTAREITEIVQCSENTVRLVCRQHHISLNRTRLDSESRKRKEIICRLTIAGKKHRETAEIVGCSVRYVRTILHKNGITSRRSDDVRQMAAPPREITPRMQNVIRSASERPQTIRQISEATGESAQFVRYALRRFGIDFLTNYGKKEAFEETPNGVIRVESETGLGFEFLPEVAERYREMRAKVLREMVSGRRRETICKEQFIGTIRRSLIGERRS